MLTLQAHVWAENTGIGVRQWAAESMGIWQGKVGLTTQQMENEVNKVIWEITHSVSIITKQGTGPEQWDLLINHCVT